MSRVLTADRVGPEALLPFLRRSFSPGKARFLEHHGAAWHGGDRNRLVLIDGGNVVAYQATIPGAVRVAGATHAASWLVDVIVDPAYRGRGFKRELDRYFIERDALLLGFPNEFSAQVHRRLGWQVRDDLRAVLLPLRAGKLGPIVRLAYTRPAIAAAAACVLRPLAALLRSGVRCRPAGGERHDPPDWERLASLDRAHARPGVATTNRTAAHFAWRYGGSPFSDHIRAYVARQGGRDRVAVMARLTGHPASPSVRLLDVFGALEDRASLRSAVLAALRDAARNATQVTALSATRELTAALRRLGFLLSRRARFCWHARDPGVRAALAGRCHWVLGDSDHDEPDDEREPVEA